MEVRVVPRRVGNYDAAFENKVDEARDSPFRLDRIPLLHRNTAIFLVAILIWREPEQLDNAVL